LLKGNEASQETESVADGKREKRKIARENATEAAGFWQFDENGAASVIGAVPVIFLSGEFPARSGGLFSHNKHYV